MIDTSSVKMQMVSLVEPPSSSGKLNGDGRSKRHHHHHLFRDPVRDSGRHPKNGSEILMTPLWSVIIPVYERRTYLRQCLESVLEQAPGPAEMEILVVDNASPTPGLDSVVHEIAGDRVRYHRNDRNLGLYASKNRGIQLTSGRLIHFLHEDDYVLPGFYDLKPSAEFGVYHTHYLNLYPDGHFWGPPAFGSHHELQERLTLGNPLQICSIILDRFVFEQIGLFREDLPHVADWDFWMRAALRTQWHYRPTALAVFRHHTDQDTTKHTTNGRAIYDTRRLLDTFNETLPDDLKLLLPTARRSYGRVALAYAVKAVEAGDPSLAALFAREGSLLLQPTEV